MIQRSRPVRVPPSRPDVRATTPAADHTPQRGLCIDASGFDPKAGASGNMFGGQLPKMRKPQKRPLTSLVPQQTKSDQEKNARQIRATRAWEAICEVLPTKPGESADQCYRRLESSFRHAGWQATRSKVMKVMAERYMPMKRLERFIACGQNCTVEVSTDGTGVRLRADYCGDRFCVPCCTAKCRRIKENLVRCMSGKNCRFITLTKKGSDASLRTILDDLLDAFRRLRESKLWRTTVEGGAFVVEITRGDAGDHWHVHLHVIVTGIFLPQADLSEAWHRCTGDSQIVDIRAVRDHERGAEYVAKYASKAFDQSVVNDRDSLQEALGALSGRRLCSTFGNWRHFRLSDTPKDDRKWKSIAPLMSVMAAAVRRETWAIGLMRALNTGIEVDRYDWKRGPPDG